MSKWDDLSPRTRRLLLIGGGIEGVLKVAALVDLARRDAEQVRGSRKWWAVAIVLINSAGAAPILYFLRGRQGRSGLGRINRGTSGNHVLGASPEMPAP